MLGCTSHAEDYVGGNFQLKAPLDDPKSFCFDIFGFGPRAVLTEPLSVRTCKNRGWKDTTFTVDYPQQGQIYSPDYDQCLQASRGEAGAHLFLRACSDSSLQRYIYRDNQTVELLSPEGARKFCVVVHPNSIKVGGGGHLRREIQVQRCDTTPAELAQWILPESGKGLVEPDKLPELIAVVQSTAPGAGLYASQCARCHGSMGEGIEDVQAPKLAGLSATYLLRQTQYYYDGVRGGTESERWASQMHYYLSDFSAERVSQFPDVSTYIASLDDMPIEPKVTGDMTQGKQLFERSCAICHGEAGLGIEDVNAPRLAGMSDWYMFRQMQKFRDGRRGAHVDDEFGGQMVPSAKALANEQEIKDVIAYINSL